MSSEITPVTSSLKALENSLRYYGQGLYRELAGKNVVLWAQAIAFKVLVTIVPIVILATGIVGRILRGNDAFTAVARFFRELLPPNQSQQLITFLEQLQSASGTIVGLGGIGLFLSALSLFVTLRIAVSNAFEQNWHRERSLLLGYLFDVRMVLQVGGLFVLTVGLSVVLPTLFNRFVLNDFGASIRWLRWLWNSTLSVTGLLLPLLITTVMFFQLYYLVPQPHPRKRSALSGALIAALLWEITKQAFTYYATYVGQFNRYSAGLEDLSALGNTFGLLIAFVFWVYFSSVILMLGAVIASLHEHRYVTAGHLPGDEPPPEALPLTDTPDRTPDATEPPVPDPSSSTARPSDTAS